MANVNIKIWLRCLFISAIMLAMLGCEEQQNVYNDDYQKPPEPDYALRGLLGVRTLRGSFEMPEGMRSYRRGLIFIEEGKVTGTTGWFAGDGLHTMSGKEKKEYAKTIHVEYMNWKNEGVWHSYFRDMPSFSWSNPKVNEDFWERFESDESGKTGLKTYGGDSLKEARFGRFQILASWWGSTESASIGSLQSVLGNMDYLALLAVEFSPDEVEEVQNEAWRKPPSNEVLQRILDDRLR